MARRRSRGFIPILALALVGVAGWLAVSAVLAVRAMAARLLVAGLTIALQGLAHALALFTLIEIATAATVWATRGPILGLAWVVARASAWQGF